MNFGLIFDVIICVSFDCRIDTNQSNDIQMGQNCLARCSIKRWFNCFKPPLVKALKLNCHLRGETAFSLGARNLTISLLTILGSKRLMVKLAIWGLVQWRFCGTIRKKFKRRTFACCLFVDWPSHESAQEFSKCIQEVPATIERSSESVLIDAQKGSYPSFENTSPHIFVKWKVILDSFLTICKNRMLKRF